MNIDTHSEPRGIGGWLAFYIIMSLVIAVPLLIVSLVAPHEGLATWSTVFDMALDIAACVLLLIKHRAAVRVVGVSLIVSFLIGTAWFIHDAHGMYTPRDLFSFLFSILQMVLWLGYFKKSRRVRNTYGSNL